MSELLLLSLLTSGCFSQNTTSEPPSTKRPGNQSIVIPFITFGSIGLICFLVFCIVRTWFLDIYSPRRVLSRGRPPRLSKGLFSWIPVVYRTKENFLINTVGLDGVMFLRYLKMGYRMFSLFTLLGMGILAPVNYYARPPNLDRVDRYEMEYILLPALSVDNVPNQSIFLRAHMAFTWVFSFLALGYITSYYRGYVRLKLQYDEHALKQTKMSKIEMRSVMVFGIPLELRNEVDLAAYFNGLGIGHVENVVVYRNWSLLRTAIQKRAYSLMQLENVFSFILHQKSKKNNKSCKNIVGLMCSMLPSRASSDEHEVRHHADPESSAPLNRRRFSDNDHVDAAMFEILSRVDLVDEKLRPKHRTGLFGLFGPEVDSVEFYAREFQHWDKQVTRLRRQSENSGSHAVGIVTFESPISAVLASQCVIHKWPFACMTKMAPEPRDMFWPNVSSKSANSYTKMIRGLLVVGSLFFLVFSSTFIVTSIAGLIDLRQLAVVFPFIGSILKDLPPTTIQFIQGVIPTSLLALWTSTLPVVLTILCRLQGLEAESWIEMSLISKYFFYQLWNVLFVTVFAPTIVYEIIPNPQKVIELLGQMVPKASTTLINYVILQGAAVCPAQLLLVAPLFFTWISRLSWTQNSPRQISDAYYPSILNCLSYGYVYPAPILLFMIGIIYAPIAPLVLPFCAMFFGIGYFVYKYILMYVHLPRYESKGAAARLAVNRSVTGVMIMQLTMMGLLAIKTIEDRGSDSYAFRVTDEGTGQSTWSDYAKVVMSAFPLLIVTAIVYSWLKQGYERQINSIPLEILGKVANDLMAKGGPTNGVGNHSQSSQLNITRNSITDNARELNFMAKVEESTSNAADEAATINSRRISGFSFTGRHATASGESSNRPGRSASLISNETSVKPETQTQQNLEVISPVSSVQLETTTSIQTNRVSSPDRIRSGFASRLSSASLMQHKMSGASMHTGRLSIFDAEFLQPSPFDEEVINDTLKEEAPVGDGSSRYTAGVPVDRNSAVFDASTSEAIQIDESGTEAGREYPGGSLPEMEERLTFGLHIEPPMTRVPGILDIPVETASAVLRYGDDFDLFRSDAEGGNDYDLSVDDMQLHTYMHPAIIGRLPIAWLPGKKQAARLVELRDAQARHQREDWRRLVDKQQVLVQVANDGEEQDEQQGVAESRPNAYTIRGFIDGIASWVYLTLS